MPDPQRLAATLHQAARAFWATPGRLGRFTRLDGDAEVMVAGDMHGNVENFRLLLRRAELAHNPGRHLILQEVTHGPFTYPAGGDKSHQVLDLVAALKCQYPARVHFLLGNHELAQWQEQKIGKGDVDQNVLFRHGVETAYGAHADAVYAGYVALFHAADLALITANRVFLSHTLPSGRHLETFDLALLEKEELTQADVRLGGGVHAIVWDRDLSEGNVQAFLQKVDADLLVTGHIPCPDTGYKVPNSRHLILDALGTPACYCLFPTNVTVTLEDLVAGIGTL